MAGLEGHSPGTGPETRRHQRTIVTDLREMAGALDKGNYQGFFDNAWDLMEQPEVQDPEVSAFLKESGSELTESDQWQEAKNYLVGSIVIADSERNAKKVRRLFDLITALGLAEKFSENPEDAEQLATLWDQYMDEQPQAAAQATIKQSRQLQQQAAEQVRSQRQQVLDQIRFAQYPGFAPEAEASLQPAYIPPETVYPPNQDGVAVIPPDTARLVMELGSGITGRSMLVSVAGLGPPLVLKTAKSDLSSIHELEQEKRALTNFRKAGIQFVPRIEGVWDATLGHGVFMEYIQGETIAQLRERSSPLPLDGVTKLDNNNREMAYLCIQLLQALAQIHGTGSIYCDLANKPNRLIWANAALPDGTIRKQLKVIDFGKVVYPNIVGNVIPKTYIHDVADAFGVILKYGFRLHIREGGLSSIVFWEGQIQATGNQDLMRVAAQLKNLNYKNTQAFCADMMPIFERML